MGVSLQIRKQFDRIAKVREAMAAAINSGTEFWALVDAASDETYENRLKGSDMTALDDALENGAIWDQDELRVWFALHQQYFNLDLGLSTPYFESYLQSVGYRVPYSAGEAIVDAMGSSARLDTTLVFPKGTYAASGSLASSGMHVFGRLTGTAGSPTYADTDGAIDTDVLIGAVMFAYSFDASPNPSSLVMTFTLQDGETTLDLGVTPSASQYGQVVVGEEAITGVSGAVFSCAETEQFIEGEYALLWENADGDTSLREIVLIDTVTEDTSVEFASAPVNTFTTSGKIVPLFTDVAYKSGTIDNTKRVDFYAKPDRIIAL